MSRWSKSKNASASGTKNRLRPGTYVLEITSLKDTQSRKKIPYDVAEFTVLDVVAAQQTSYKGNKDPEARIIESNPEGDHASEMFWFDDNDDLVDLTYGRFKQFCCACLGINESDADEFTDEEWDDEVEGLHGRGTAPNPAVGKRILAIVTKETVAAGTHNYTKTTFAPFHGAADA